MGNKTLLLVLVILLLFIPINNNTNFTIASTSTIAIEDSNTSTNTDLLDISFVSLKSEQGQVSGDGTYYQVVSDTTSTFLEFDWKIQGLTSFSRVTGKSDGLMGDTYISVDSKMDRLYGDYKNTPASDREDKSLSTYLTLTQGVHTLSIIYIGISENGNLLYDIESIFIEVRSSEDAFGFELGQSNAYFNIEDIHEPNNFTKKLVAGDPSSKEPNRVLPRETTINSVNYFNNNTFALDATVNSSGSLDYQNKTGQVMTPGLFFYSDASGVYPITNLTSSIIVFSGEYTTLGFHVIRDAGFFSERNQDQYEWDGLGIYLGANDSYDAIIEDTQILFKEDGVEIISQTHFDSTINTELLKDLQYPGETSSQSSSSDPKVNLLPISNLMMLVALSATLLVRRYYR